MKVFRVRSDWQGHRGGNIIFIADKGVITEEIDSKLFYRDMYVRIGHGHGIQMGTPKSGTVRGVLVTPGYFKAQSVESAIKMVVRANKEFFKKSRNKIKSFTMARADDVFISDSPLGYAKTEIVSLSVLFNAIDSIKAK